MNFHSLIFLFVPYPLSRQRHDGDVGVQIGVFRHFFTGARIDIDRLDDADAELRAELLEIEDRWKAAIRTLDWRTLGRLTLIAIDRGVQMIGDVAIEFLKAASVWMLGIAGVVVWVWTIVAILMKVNFPASLILAGLVFSFPIWYYSTRFSNSDKSN